MQQSQSNQFNHLKWDQRFLALARFVSTWSKDPSTKVGAVITQEKRIISLGFNGLPPGMLDTSEVLENRDEKYKHIIHAEKNALDFAGDDLPYGFTIYVYPFMPCDVCAERLCNRQVGRVVSIKNDNPRWAESFFAATDMFEKKKTELILYQNVEDLV